MTREKPNILLIMADQLVPFLTGPYGHKVVRTPHLDRLAREGVVFDAAYSPCPVCAPARAAMLTGKYVSRIGAYDNAAAFSSEEPTIPHCLTLAGYDAVLSGKMHFIGADQLHGYSRRFTSDIYPADFSWVPVRGKDQTSERLHALNYVGEAIQVGQWNQYLSADEETHFRAVEYLRAKAVKRDSIQGKSTSSQPFFLTVSYHHPHEPFMPPLEFWNLYEGDEIDIPDYPDKMDSSYSMMDRWLNTYHGVSKAKNLRNPDSIRRMRRAYYALITYIDHKVGQLLDVLEKGGFLDNTVILFTSDHGDMLCEHGMVQKRTFYEWSSRIPMILRFPDQDAAGSRVNTPANLVDVFPTLLDIARFPEKDRMLVDGHSLLPVINKPGARDSYTFSEYHSQGSHAACFMVRQGDYKYIYIHGHASQLFNVKTDPGEWTNLAGLPQFSEVENKLKRLILTHFDPAAIDQAVAESVRRRWLLKEAMDITGTRWDYEPRFDPHKPVTDQYLPG